MTDRQTLEFLIVGGGMAGISCGYELAKHGRVAVLEREEHPGFHTTGRSAALFSAIYGNAVIRQLSAASRDFLEMPPPGLSDRPFVSSRGTLFAADRENLASLDEMAAGAGGLLRPVGQAEMLAMIPILRPEYAVSGLFEEDAKDLDVNGLLQAFLRGMRARGGLLVTGADVQRASRSRGSWEIETPAGVFVAPVLINAAGAWADAVASLAGARPRGLVPLRRTAILVDAPPDSGSWPCMIDASESFYFKPDAGRLLISPADETPSPPCDAQPEELDIAIAIDRFETSTTMTVRRPSHRWAGLRTFAPDRSPIIGFDVAAEGFFWLAGQGGYGIQTAPAIAVLAAALASGREVPDGLAHIDLTALSPRRFG